MTENQSGTGTEARPKTARFIRDVGWKGDARLYRVDPPMLTHSWGDEDASPTEHEHVIVSAVVAMYSGPETYIFPATAEGEAVDMLEMDGSFRGALDHEQALRNAGYEVVS
jgi:hypothetical protein